MSSSPRGLWFWVGAWLPVLVGMGAIALESTSFLGADHTSGPFRWFYQILFGAVNNARWNEIHFYLRKSGHFIGYGTLGLLWLRAWWLTLPRSEFFVDTMLAFAGAAMTAGADEFHQSFLPNRTGTPWDVLLDCCGVLAMQLLVYLFMRIFRPKKLVKAYNS